MPDVVQIPMQRARAVIRPGSISIRPGRSQLLVPLAQAAIAGGAVWVMATFINSLPMWVLVVLLVIAILVGPAAVLGFVYNIYGTEFLVERRKGTARWHQGFLGLGIGTFELVPFDRIARIEVQSDFDQDLSSGQLQDFVEFDVRIVKDNDRVLDVASVTSAYAFIEDAAGRANRLGAALAEMTGRALVSFEVPESALAPAPARPSRRRMGRRVARPRTEE
ncbi:MAG: hypothetical protein EXR66_06520 [Dehalococcoidia bacterium]|nr:hypothetical protein [Dehalococcoidia bacterium]